MLGGTAVWLLCALATRHALLVSCKFNCLSCSEPFFWWGSDGMRTFVGILLDIQYIWLSLSYMFGFEILLETHPLLLRC
jgi:hypothetical protein